MPRVSKTRQITSNKKRLFIDDFYSAITSLKDKDEVRCFFEDILTQEEKLMLGKRFQIAMMLKLDYLWGEISERVKVTNVTISNIRQLFDYGLGGLKDISERILNIKEQKKQQFEKRKQREHLGPAIIKAGLGVLIQKRKRKRREKSITG